MDLLPGEQLKELAGYLDQFPSAPEGDEEQSDEYWRLLINELRNSPTTSRQCNYTNVQIEDFATEALKDRSPSLKLLYDLRVRKLSFDVFLTCLEKIQCTGAVNMFRATGEFGALRQGVNNGSGSRRYLDFEIQKSKEIHNYRIRSYFCEYKFSRIA